MKNVMRTNSKLINTSTKEVMRMLCTHIWIVNVTAVDMKIDHMLHKHSGYLKFEAIW